MLRLLSIFAFLVLLAPSLSFAAHPLASASRPPAGPPTPSGNNDTDWCTLAPVLAVGSNVTTVTGTLEDVPLITHLFSYLQPWISRSPALYYRFTGVSGKVRINSCLTGSDSTDIAVFVSNEPWDLGSDEAALAQYCKDAYATGSLVPLVGHQGPDKVCTTRNGGNTSLPGGVDLYFCAQSNYFYLIRVEDNTWPFGEFTFEISIVDEPAGANETTCASPAENTQCDTATNIELGTPVSGNSDLVPLAVYGPTYACVLDSTFANDVWNPLWYSVVGTGGRFQLTWLNYEYDVVVSVFAYSGANNVTEPCNNLVCITGRDDINPTSYQTAADLTWDTEYNAIYRIAVFGYSYQGGAFTFEVNEIGNCTCPILPRNPATRQSLARSEDPSSDSAEGNLFYLFEGPQQQE